MDRIVRKAPACLRVAPDDVRAARCKQNRARDIAIYLSRELRETAPQGGRNLTVNGLLPEAMAGVMDAV